MGDYWWHNTSEMLVTSMPQKCIDANAPQSSFPQGGSLKIVCCYYGWGFEEHQIWKKVGDQMVRTGERLKEGRWGSEAEVRKNERSGKGENWRQKGEGSSPPLSHSK